MSSTTPPAKFPVISVSSNNTDNPAAATAKKQTSINPFLPVAETGKRTPDKTTKPQYTWKPGHGTIEKVDKRTGEIFHLAECR